MPCRRKTTYCPRLISIRLEGKCFVFSDYMVCFWLTENTWLPMLSPSVYCSYTVCAISNLPTPPGTRNECLWMKRSVWDASPPCLLLTGGEYLISTIILPVRTLPGVGIWKWLQRDVSKISQNGGVWYPTICWWPRTYGEKKTLGIMSRSCMQCIDGNSFISQQQVLKSPWRVKPTYSQAVSHGESSMCSVLYF